MSSEGSLAISNLGDRHLISLTFHDFSLFLKGFQWLSKAFRSTSGPESRSHRSLSPATCISATPKGAPRADRLWERVALEICPTHVEDRSPPGASPWRHAVRGARRPPRSPSSSSRAGDSSRERPVGGPGAIFSTRKSDKIYMIYDENG